MIEGMDKEQQWVYLYNSVLMTAGEVLREGLNDLFKEDNQKWIVKELMRSRMEFVSEEGMNYLQWLGTRNELEVLEFALATTGAEIPGLGKIILN